MVDDKVWKRQEAMFDPIVRDNGDIGMADKRLSNHVNATIYPVQLLVSVGQRELFFVVRSEDISTNVVQAVKGLKHVEGDERPVGPVLDTSRVVILEQGRGHSRESVLI